MLKRLMMLLMMFLVIGCVGSIKRGVQNNTFYSTYPELAVKLAPEFEYVENEKSTDATHSDQGGMGYNSIYGIEKFVFMDRLTRRGGEVSISKLNGRHVSWSTDLTSEIPNLINSGYEDHHGKRYQYAVYSIQDDNGGCFLAKSIARVVGGKMDTLLEIFYFELLSDLQQECLQWKDGQTGLDDTQQKHLKQFLENSTRNMRLIDPTELELAG